MPAVTSDAAPLLVVPSAGSTSLLDDEDETPDVLVAHTPRLGKSALAMIKHAQEHGVLPSLSDIARVSADGGLAEGATAPVSVMSAQLQRAEPSISMDLMAPPLAPSELSVGDFDVKVRAPHFLKPLSAKLPALSTPSIAVPSELVCSLSKVSHASASPSCGGEPDVVRCLAAIDARPCSRARWAGVRS